MSSSSQVVSPPMPEDWGTRATDIQSDGPANCEEWCIPSPDFYASPEVPEPLSEDYLALLSAAVSGFQDPLFGLDADDNLLAAPAIPQTRENAIPLSEPNYQFRIQPPPLYEPRNEVGAQEQRASSTIRRMRSGRRIQVPLKEWHAQRTPKGPQIHGVIEFWSIEHATGNTIPGTYLADRFRDDTGRSFLSEGELPFPNKKEKGLNFRLLWPEYPEFSKKISIHRPLSECSLGDVRDWVFSALADFIRAPGVAQGQVSGFWRVGEDDDVEAIHLNDIVLVRLKQVGKGTWVPELDILD